MCKLRSKQWVSTHQAKGCGKRILGEGNNFYHSLEGKVSKWSVWSIVGVGGRLRYVLSYIWLFATPWTVAPPASSVHGIFQAGILERILEWVAISCSTRSSQPRCQTLISCISWIWRQILYHWTTGKQRKHGGKITKGLKVIVTIFLKGWFERTALKHV